MTTLADFEEPKESIDLVAFDTLCRDLWDARDEAEIAEQHFKEKSARCEALKAKVQAYMDDAGMEKYHCASRGLVYTTQRMSVTVPKDDDRRAQFFAYLRDKGVFENLITVNFQTLNALYKAEFEAAVAAGLPDYKMPGIGEPSFAKTLTMRRGK